jgi:hypothetical protein
LIRKVLVSFLEYGLKIELLFEKQQTNLKNAEITKIPFEQVSFFL